MSVCSHAHCALWFHAGNGVLAGKSDSGLLRAVSKALQLLKAVDDNRYRRLRVHSSLCLQPCTLRAPRSRTENAALAETRWRCGKWRCWCSSCRRRPRPSRRTRIRTPLEARAAKNGQTRWLRLPRRWSRCARRAGPRRGRSLFATMHVARLGCVLRMAHYSQVAAQFGELGALPLLLSARGKHGPTVDRALDAALRELGDSQV